MAQPSRSTFLGLALCAPLIGAMPAIGQDDTQTQEQTTNEIDARAMELLNSVNQQLNSEDQFSVRIDQSMTMRSAFGNEDSESSHELAVSKPNKLAIKGSDATEETVVSDGEKLYTHIPAMRGYIETDAPETLSQVFKNVQSRSVASGGGPLSFISPLIAPNGYEGELATITGATYEGTEDIDGTTMHHVSIVMVPTLDATAREQLQEQFNSDDMTFYLDAWIDDSETPRFHKMEFDLGKMLQGLMADMMEQMPQLSEMTYDMELTFSDYRTGDDVSPSHFAFSPPEGATKASSMEELITASQPGSPDELLGKAAPEFEAQLLSGESMSLQQHKGSDVVILDFWATWCGPCIRAMPDLMDVAQQYKDRNVVFYAVNVQEANEKIQSFIDERKWDLTIPLDSDGAISNQFNVSGIPQTVVIGMDGTVQAVHVGYSPQIKQQLSSELDTLLAGEKLAE